MITFPESLKTPILSITRTSNYSVVSNEDDTILGHDQPLWSLWKFAALCELFIIIILLIIPPKSNQITPFSRSLVRDAIEYETRIFHNSVSKDLTSFQGPPSPELDLLWLGLYDGGLIRLSKDEARALPNRTSEIPGSPGNYISTLAVFHHIHCLNFLRKTLYPDYYLEVNLNNATMREHAEHCIDILRQAHMCFPDTTAGVWQWSSRINKSVATWDVARTCVNFEGIQEWVKRRALRNYDENVWVEGNPVYHRT